MDTPFVPTFYPPAELDPEDTVTPHRPLSDRGERSKDRDQDQRPRIPPPTPTRELLMSSINHQHQHLQPAHIDPRALHTPATEPLDALCEWWQEYQQGYPVSMPRDEGHGGLHPPQAQLQTQTHVPHHSHPPPHHGHHARQSHTHQHKQQQPSSTHPHSHTQPTHLAPSLLQRPPDVQTYTPLPSRTTPTPDFANYFTAVAAAAPTPSGSIFWNPTPTPRHDSEAPGSSASSESEGACTDSRPSTSSAPAPHRQISNAGISDSGTSAHSANANTNTRSTSSQPPQQHPQSSRMASSASTPSSGLPYTPTPRPKQFPAPVAEVYGYPGAGDMTASTFSALWGAQTTQPDQAHAGDASLILGPSPRAHSLQPTPQVVAQHLGLASPNPQERRDDAAAAQLPMGPPAANTAASPALHIAAQVQPYSQTQNGAYAHQFPPWVSDEQRKELGGGEFQIASGSATPVYHPPAVPMQHQQLHHGQQVLEQPSVCLFNHHEDPSNSNANGAFPMGHPSRQLSRRHSAVPALESQSHEQHSQPREPFSGSVQNLFPAHPGRAHTAPWRFGAGNPTAQAQPDDTPVQNHNTAIANANVAHATRYGEPTRPALPASAPAPVNASASPVTAVGPFPPVTVQIPVQTPDGQIAYYAVPIGPDRRIPVPAGLDVSQHRAYMERVNLAYQQRVQTIQAVQAQMQWRQQFGLQLAQSGQTQALHQFQSQAPEHAQAQAQAQAQAHAQAQARVQALQQLQQANAQAQSRARQTIQNQVQIHSTPDFRQIQQAAQAALGVANGIPMQPPVVRPALSTSYSPNAASPASPDAPGRTENEREHEAASGPATAPTPDLHGPPSPHPASALSTPFMQPATPATPATLPATRAAPTPLPLSAPTPFRIHTPAPPTPFAAPSPTPHSGTTPRWDGSDVFDTQEAFLAAAPPLLITIGNNSFNLLPRRMRPTRPGLTKYGYGIEEMIQTELRGHGPQNVHVSLLLRFPNGGAPAPLYSPDGTPAAEKEAMEVDEEHSHSHGEDEEDDEAQVNEMRMATPLPPSPAVSKATAELGGKKGRNKPVQAQLTDDTGSSTPSAAPPTAPSEAKSKKRSRPTKPKNVASARAAAKEKGQEAENEKKKEKHKDREGDRHQESDQQKETPAAPEPAEDEKMDVDTDLDDTPLTGTKRKRPAARPSRKKDMGAQLATTASAGSASGSGLVEALLPVPMSVPAPKKGRAGSGAKSDSKRARRDKDE